MEIWHSIVLGIVEGITEFLPISSTGHLILASNLLGIAPETFSKSFDIVIQFGAIASVVVLYWKKLIQVEILKRIVAAFIPTGVIGLILYKFLKTYLIGNVTVVLCALFIGGIVIILFELWYKRREVVTRGETIQEIDKITYKQALVIGIFQSISIIPGVSRSASTILGGLLFGLSRRTIVEFSFLLAVPTILAASGLDLLKNYSYFASDQFVLLTIGFFVSFFIAIATIKFFLSFVKRYNFIPFGVYRIVIAILFWVLVI